MIDEGSEPVRLTKGANVSLRSLDEELGSITVLLETVGSVGSSTGGDVSVLLLGEDGHVRSNDDFVFYNQPLALAGAVHLRDKYRAEDEETSTSTDVVTVNLDDVPDEVSRIVLAASLDPQSGLTFGEVTRLTMRIDRSTDARTLVEFSIEDLSSETAVLFGEFYRRGGEWKVRAIGQGYDGGLAQLVTDFGVDVDADDASALEPEAEPPPSEEGPQEEAPVEVSPSLQEPTRSAPTEAPASQGPKVSVRRPSRPPRLPADWDTAMPADSESDWQPARLFPVAGIGGAEEQERRATSALLAVLRLVKEFGRAVVSKVGAPAGTLETFIEVPFGLDEQAYRPDGVLVVTPRPTSMARACRGQDGGRQACACAG